MLDTSFAQFSGSTVTWSDYSRKCAACRRMIGKIGKSYTYGKSQVCRRCHGRKFRRYTKKHPIATSL